MAAIYMWPTDNQIILTTTLYPVDVQDGLTFSARVSGGAMAEIAKDYITSDLGAISASYVQKRWYYTDDAGEDFTTSGFGAISASYVQKRWYFFEDAGEEFITSGFGAISASLRNLLVIGDTPDESLQISITINNTCTMELI